MNDATQKKSVLKQKAIQELTKYLMNFVYLACFFGAFTWYRRFILAEYRITYMHYGIAVIEALILAKVILIGDAIHLGRGFEERPLIWPTLYKAVVFTIFVGIFGVFEHAIGGWLHGEGLMGGIHKLMSSGKYELLTRCLITFFAFIPFFAFQELGQVLGEGKIRKLFFRRRTAPGFDSFGVSEQPAH
jgi:hypothetical protein